MQLVSDKEELQIEVRGPLHFWLPTQVTGSTTNYKCKHNNDQSAFLATGCILNTPLSVSSACLKKEQIQERQLAQKYPQACNQALLISANWCAHTCLNSVPRSGLSAHMILVCLHDYHPVAFTFIVLKCFERLVMTTTKRNITAIWSCLLFAYRGNH